MTPRTVVIVGPTASGKSAVALALAQLLGDADLVSVDSMQVYRGMDVGTAKPSPAEQASVRHHMIDLIDPAEESSVGWFQREALGVLDQLSAATRRAILVGGTGLYHRAVTDRLEIPPEYPDVRAEMERELDNATDRAAHVASLYRELAAADRIAASRCEPTNARRLIRALEVVRGSGRPFSSFGPGLEQYPASTHLMIGLSVPRDELRGRIARRLESMMAAGFVDEVRGLSSVIPPMSRTARQALGYRELLAHVRGETSEADAVAETIARTRQFAVRQERWFRRDPRIRWLDASCGTDESIPALAAVIAGTLDTS